MSRTAMLMLKQASGQRIVTKQQQQNGQGEHFARASNHHHNHNHHHHHHHNNHRHHSHRRCSTPSSSPISQEMFTFVAHDDNHSARRAPGSDNGSESGDGPLPPPAPTYESHRQQRNSNHNNNISPHNQRRSSRTPSWPPLEAASRRGRLKPLTIEEYEANFRTSASDLALIERVFAGSIACNQLRAALWPYLFGIVPKRGRFQKLHCDPNRQAADGQAEHVHVYAEHEENKSRWRELERLYELYAAQWRNVLPEQEARFTTFRERKSMIERDVIRCDRLHPFYAEKPKNLAKLTNLLMTYMMYDFDIGYVQGMSDLAGPILYMYKGDLIKSFWVFVEVMKLFRRNFELTQKTIQFQLSCLFGIIKSTDPVFARYLQDNESSNCFFAFRAIVCQFKRELMKEDGDDYSKVLFLWDAIWCVEKMQELADGAAAGKHNGAQNGHNGHTPKPSNGHTNNNDSNDNTDRFVNSIDQNQANSPRYKLTETEIFVLALCLSMIRRERDLIMANKLDGTDIHLHFIDPKLTSDLNGFIEHATNIYLYLKNSFDLKQITSPKRHQHQAATIEHSSPVGSSNGIVEIGTSPISLDGYDFLSDFLIINGVSGT